MKYSLYTTEKIDFTKEPIFFGEGRNIQRYENPKYPFFDKLSQEMWKLHWTETEVNLSKDKNDFMNLTDSEKHIFTSNIKFQTLLDSIQGRAPFQTFGQVCTLPEVEDCLIKIDCFEVLHSRAYTHILRNIFTKPQEILDEILDEEMIIERAGQSTWHPEESRRRCS
jgi:ribonucleoside-diphosphate reductase beta chain